MVTPETYNCIKCNTPYTAENASETVIDPDKVKEAVEKLINSMNDATKNITVAIRNIETEAAEAYKQNETKTIVESMEGICKTIEDTISKEISQKGIEEFPKKAMDLHDEKQKEFNDTAKRKASECAASHKENQETE